MGKNKHNSVISWEIFKGHGALISKFVILLIIGKILESTFFYHNNANSPDVYAFEKVGHPKESKYDIFRKSFEGL